MNSIELEQLISTCLDEFYQRRLQKLDTLKLGDMLKKKNPYLFCAISTQKASDIIEDLISAYMSFFDEGIFYDAVFKPIAKQMSGSVVSPSEDIDWEELTGDPDFYLKLIRLMKDHPAHHRVNYEESWNKAVNRFTSEFLDDFSLADGSIDWEKLVIFNSGKVTKHPRPPSKKRVTKQQHNDPLQLNAKR